MLFTESEINYSSYSGPLTAIDEAYGILEDAIYIDQISGMANPLSVPVLESSIIGTPVVKYSDVERLSEENSVSYIDSMVAIAEANGILPNALAVSVPEYEIIANPHIVDELANVVITPTPSNDIVKLYTESCLFAFMETGDPYFLDVLYDDYLLEDAPQSGSDFGYQMAQGMHRYQQNLDKRQKQIADDAKKKQERQAKAAEAKIEEKYKNAIFQSFMQFKNDPEKMNAALYGGGIVFNSKDKDLQKYNGKKLTANSLRPSERKGIDEWLSKNSKFVDKPGTLNKKSASADAYRKMSLKVKDNLAKEQQRLDALRAANARPEILKDQENKIKGLEEKLKEYGTKSMNGPENAESKVSPLDVQSIIKARNAEKAAAGGGGNPPDGPNDGGNGNGPDNPPEPPVVDSKSAEETNDTPADNGSTQVTDKQKEEQSDSSDKGGDDAQKKYTFWLKLKDTLINKPRTFLARKLQAIRNWADKNLKDLDSKPEKDRGIWYKIKQKVYEIIRWIMDRLGSKEGRNEKDIDYTNKKELGVGSYDD